MTRYLWTGESEFCICGHHPTDHKTITNILDGISICQGHKRTMANKRHSNPIFHNYAVLNIDVRCRCKQFKPYRTIHA